jgi:hypothetical protein
MTDRVKILIEFEGSTSHTHAIESVWAVVRPRGYEIDNIPFYAYGVALGDVVDAKPDIDGALQFKSVSQPSGHSTVRLWFAEGGEKDVARVRQELRSLGCSSELTDLPRLVAVDIPPNIDYKSIKAILDSWEKSGMLEYEESCLGFVAPP